jgi:CRISPR-associated protein Cmr6
MSIVAVPAYLGNDFSAASPGMRFGMYLKAWDMPNWSKSNDRPLDDAKRLGPNDNKIMQALFERQQQAFNVVADSGAMLCLDAIATAPFTTGLGNEHPLENGFAFLNPYGLPYLPGSGVKGVLRQAVRELASGDWGDSHGWDDAAITALFGREGKDGDKEHQRGALGFWDVIPQIAGDSLDVEIMTPHQKHYYQDGQTPHDSGQPNPLRFLTVPPKSRFVFHVQCDTRFLHHLAPELGIDGRWKALMRAAFAHAFDWCGFGAKTAVGYGAMAEHPDIRAERERQERVEQEARLKQDELQRQQAAEAARAEADAKRQAEFDALPESEKAMIKFREGLQSVQGQAPLNKDQYAELAGIINRLVEQARAWGDTGARNTAAEAIEAAYEKFGWTPSGLKPDKRKKQEQKRRDQLEEIRKGG